MNLSKRSALIALTAAMSLAGCDRNAQNPDKNPDNQVSGEELRQRNGENAEVAQQDDAPRTDENQEKNRSDIPPAIVNNDAKDEDAKDQRAQKDDSEGTPQILVTPGPQVGDAPRMTQSRTIHAERSAPEQQPAERKRGVVGATKGAVLGTGAAIGYYGSELYHAWRPTQETTGRRDALDSIHDQKSKTRAAAPSDLGTLKAQIAQTSPDSERVSSIVSVDSETKRLLVNVLTEKNPEAVAGASERLVDEVFKVADQADGKVQQVQMSLRELAMNDAYDVASSARVSYLQTELDKRIAADDLQSTLKRGSFLVLTTAAAAAFGGFNGVERTAAYVNSIPFRRGAEAVGEGVEKAKSPRFWNRWRKGLNKKVDQGTDAAVETGSSIASRVRGAASRLNVAVRKPFIKLRPIEQAKADVRELLTEAAKTNKALDVEATIKTLNLKRTYLKNLPEPSARAEHEITYPTAKPGLHVMATNNIQGVKTDVDHYRIVLMFQRQARKVKTGTTTGTAAENELKSVDVFYSEQLRDQVTHELVSTLEGVKLPKREFVVVDAQTGALASDVEKKEVAAAIVGEEGAPAVTQAGSVQLEGAGPGLADTTQTHATLAEEQIATGADIDKVIEDGKAGVENLQKRAADTVAKTTEKVGTYKDRSIAAIKGDKPFDPAKAALVGSLVGVPAYLFSRSAYYQGRRAGEGYDTLYLEDLIPADRLQKVVLPTDGQAAE